MPASRLMPQSIESFRRDLLAAPRPVVIVGAGVVSETLWHACHDLGIAVAAFCDNNRNKTRAPKCGLPVLHTPELPQHFTAPVFLIGVADIDDVVRQLTDLGFTDLHSGGFLLRHYDVTAHVHGAAHDFVEYAVATCLNCHDNYLAGDALFLRSVDLIVTEKCSLKCRDCSNLMQYYRDPHDCPPEELDAGLDGLLSLVDAVNEIRVIGGEPFMNRDVYRVVRRLSREEQVRRVIIYTNGTIVPNPEQIADLRSPKTLVLITDYGPLSRSRARLEHSLAQNGIQSHTVKAGGWSACSRIGRHHRSDAEQCELFASCCAKNTATLSQGRLFRCPFSANAARLGAVPLFPGDSVLLPTPAATPDELQSGKRALQDFLLRKAFLASCDYCDGRPFGAAEIEPAIQTAQALHYEFCL